MTTSEWLENARLLKLNQELIAKRARCRVMINTIDTVIAKNQVTISDSQQKQLTK